MPGLQVFATDKKMPKCAIYVCFVYKSDKKRGNLLTKLVDNSIMSVHLPEVRPVLIA